MMRGLAETARSSRRVCPLGLKRWGTGSDGDLAVQSATSVNRSAARRSTASRAIR